MNKITLRILVIVFFISASLTAQNETCSSATAIELYDTQNGLIVNELWFSFVAPDSGQVVIDFSDYSSDSSLILDIQDNCSTNEVLQYENTINGYKFSSLQSGYIYYIVTSNPSGLENAYFSLLIEDGIFQNKSCDVASPVVFNTEIGGYILDNLWYSFVAPESGNVSIEVLLNFSGSQLYIDLINNCLDNEYLLPYTFDPISNTAWYENLVSGQTYNILIEKMIIPHRNESSSRLVETNFSFRILDDALLSVTNLAAENNTSYSPNPVKDNLSIKSPKEINNIEVFNMLGEIIYTEIPNSVNVNIDFSSLASGMYLVNVTSNLGTQYLKILKN